MTIKLFRPAEELVPLESYGQLSEGLDTGANDFFVIKPSQVQDWFLPEQAVSYCVSNSAHIQNPVFTPHHLQQLVKSNKSICLINLEQEDNIPCQRYILFGEDQKYPLRPRLHSRQPWYHLEKRIIPDFLFSAFNCDKVQVTHNLAGVRHLSCCHGLVLNELGRQHLKSLFCFFHSSFGQQLLKNNSRQFSEGLHRLNVKHLKQMQVPSPGWLQQFNTHMINVAYGELGANHSLPLVCDNAFSSQLWKTSA